MKRFINYQREDGEVYEICCDVMECNTCYLTIGFSELKKTEVLVFVANNGKVMCFANEGEKLKVMIPLGMVNYMGNEMPTANEIIRCCYRVTKKEKCDTDALEELKKEMKS